MIRRKPKSPPATYLTPPPEDWPLTSSNPASDWDADDEGTMSAGDPNTSRPPSLDDQVNAPPYFPPRPTLSDVLSNSSPHPWTLSAFTAYLSQNHCLENLEFTMDAERYRDRYKKMAGQMNGKAMNSDSKECNHMRMLWKRLMDAYVIPDGPREINIPSYVRETLLSLPNHTAPPSPEELSAAAKIVYDLMEESVLVSFLNESPTAMSIEVPSIDTPRNKSSRIRRAVSSRERKSTRSRSRRRPSPSSSSLEVQATASDWQPTSSALMSSATKRSRAQSHLSSDSGELSLTNDSTSASSPGHEPMTPPNTPPSSDVGGSPRNRTDHTWKKMLVWKKKSSQGMRDNRFPTLED